MQKLYLIECEGFVKIGVAYDLRRRLAELSTGNPFELRVLSVYNFSNARVMEAALHEKFSNLQARSEWFLMTEKDISEFHSLCVALGGQLADVPPGLNESEVEAIKNEMLQDDEDRLYQEEKITQLYREGKSQRHIEKTVYGYCGGTAANRVSEIVKRITALEESKES